MSELTSLVPLLATYRVSSVLNREVRQFGKKHLLDGDEETCWNSDQGSPQWIHLAFSQPVTVRELHIQFQGGFAGRQCRLDCVSPEGASVVVQEFYPEDVNSLQVIPVAAGPAGSAFRIVFQQSTDFFGRITIYKLDLIGTGPHTSS